MKRTVAKIAFVGTLWLVVAVICIEVNNAVRSFWTAGLSGAFGYLTYLYGTKLFDRLWPKPMKGWAE